VLWVFISLCPAPSIGAADGIKRADLSESRRSLGEGRTSFRALRPHQPVDAASIVPEGKALDDTRRAAIVRL
jgi:hypothetical protein